MGKASQFLKIIDKNNHMVEGECFNHEHLNEIDLSGWNWDVSDPQVPKTAGKSKADDATKAKPKPKSNGEATDTKPKPSKLSITKKTDSSTLRLLTAMDRGEVFPTALLVLKEEYQGSEATKPFYLEIELSKVFVVSFGWQASAESAGMTFEESWELNYEEIHFRYNWRGVGTGWIQQAFNRPADDSGGTSTKTPATKAEKAAEEEERFKAIAKKSGDANEEERFKAYLKKQGLIK